MRRRRVRSATRLVYLLNGTSGLPMRSRFLSGLILGLLAVGGVPATAQPVVINEILASNAETLADPDYGEFGDWIELYNGSEAAVDLGGYSLTDDLGADAESRWAIPAGTVLGAGAYLVVWADDYDAGPPATSALHTDFKLSAGGEQVGLFSPAGVVVDSLTYGDQSADVAYGRFPDGAGTWALLETPTPGAANTDAPAEAPPLPPSLSLASGFYAGGETVALETAVAGVTVRYTLDGTDPTEASTPLSAPLALDATTVLRAAAFADGGLASETVTRTYFVGESSTLPVISLVTDPAGFFSDEDGIYVEGTNGIPGRCRTDPVNWNQDWERPVHLSFFEPDGAGGFALALDQGAGVQIFGGCSRIYPQKSLSLHARGRYGASDFAYRFFDDVDVESFDDLVLRSSAQDWWRTMFRDGMIQTVTRHMDLDGQAYRPTVVFLNGEYWGIHNLREKLNEDYVAGHYGYDDSDVEVIESTRRGASENFDPILDILDTADLNRPETLTQLDALMDVDQYLNYLIAEIYSANADWPGNNLKLWRPKTPEGRWRWMLFDTDFGFGGNAQGQPESNTLALATAPDAPGWPNPPWSTYLFRSLLENDGFRHAFVQRLAAHINTTFAPPRVLGVIDSLEANIEAEMPRHKARWPESASFAPTWSDLVDVMRDFARTRAPNVRGHVNRQFPEVVGSARLWVAATEGGRVMAEGVPLPRAAPDAPFESVFFRGVPLTLRAVPDEGYTFTGWSGLASAAGDSLDVMLDGEATITASFTAGSVDAEADPESPRARLSAVYPNPASRSATVEVWLPRSGPLSVRLVDLLGREVALLAEGRTAAGTHRLRVPTRALPGGVYTVLMEAGGTLSTRRLVVAR